MHGNHYDLKAQYGISLNSAIAPLTSLPEKKTGLWSFRSKDREEVIRFAGTIAMRLTRELERQPQSERHYARNRRSEAEWGQTLRLSKGSAVQVSVNTVEVGVIKNILALRPEVELHGFRQLEALA